MQTLTIVLCLIFSFSNCVFSKFGEYNEPLDWWQKTILYQVYPRSFKDSNGDGVGDIKGIEEKAEYFQWLGVNAIWLNPIYESPMVDFGYDISNYTKVYDKFGTIDDLKSLAKKLKKLGIKLILDFVPNHTSDECEWFKKSIKKIDPYTDYYVWKDPKGWDENGNPILPNNWISALNVGPTWTFNQERQQFYLNHFHPKMPDLNFRSENVIKELENVLLFWLDVGVDGMRIDAVPFLVEDDKYLDEEYIDPNGPKDDHYHNIIHAYTKDHPDTYKILRRWRKLFDDYTKNHGTETKLFLTEAYTTLDKTMMYYGTKEEPIAQIPFNFDLIVYLSPQSTSSDYAKVINDWLDNMPVGMWPNWVIGNHDRQRVATLFGLEMVDALNILVNMLPGTSSNYYGDELGMQNAFIRWDQTMDPTGLALGKEKYHTESRDGCRTPMQWDDSTNAGFSTASKTWLPVNSNFWNVNYKAQSSKNISHVTTYKQLADARRTFVTLQRGDFHIYTPDNWTIIFTRTYQNHPTFIIVMNIGTEEIHPDLTVVRAKLPDHVYVLVASTNSVHQRKDKLKTRPKSFSMRPKSALVLITEDHTQVAVSSSTRQKISVFFVVICTYVIMNI